MYYDNHSECHILLNEFSELSIEFGERHNITALTTSGLVGNVFLFPKGTSMTMQIKKIKNYVVLGKYELDMVLDIHAHTALTGLFVYGNSYDDVYRSHKNSALFGNILFCILF